MKKNIKKSILVLFLILLLTSGCKKKNDDNIKFKNEFESLNEQYSIVSIKEENPFKYKTQEEIDELIKSKETFVVLYGNSKNNDTRSIIEQLINLSYNNNLGTIYYVSREDNIPLLIGYIKGEEYSKTSEINESNDILSKVAIELNTCNIETGC